MIASWTGHGRPLRVGWGLLRFGRLASEQRAGIAGQVGGQLARQYAKASACGT